MKKVSYPILLLSFFISLSINLKIIIVKSLDKFINNFHIDFCFIGKVVILCLVLYFLFNILFKIIDKITLIESNVLLTNKFIIFIILFIPTIIYLLSHYPAVYLNDTIFMLYHPISKMNPVIYGMFMSIIFFSLKVFFNSTITVFILSIIQSIISCLILTYAIFWFNKKVNNKVLNIILICYYSFLPIIANYNMSLDKDTPFSILMLLFFIFVFEIIKSKGNIITNKRFLIKFMIICSLCIFVRRNGIGIVLITSIILFIKYGIYNQKKYWISIILFLLLLPGVENIALKHWDRSYNKSEAYAIPIQQISYLAKYDSDKLSNNDYKLLSKIIKNPKDNLKKDYNVYSVDDIKFSEYFDKDKFNKYEKNFLGLWIRKFPNNISSYTKSFLLNDYHLWSISKLEKRQSIFSVASISFVDKEEQIHNKRILPKNIYNYLIKYYDIFNTYLNPAGCFILLIITNVYAYTRGKKEILLISIPLIVLWCVLILGTPLSSALRYMAPYLYILPIIILYTFHITRENDVDENKRKSKKELSK